VGIKRVSQPVGTACRTLMRTAATWFVVACLTIDAEIGLTLDWLSLRESEPTPGKAGIQG
jgi:hypothetical protein